MKGLVLIATVAGLLAGPLARAQQASQFDGYVVHYNTLNTNQLTPQVAQSYGIQRSASRALLNITVMREDGRYGGQAISARIEASAKNLTGQRRDIEMREIREGEDAIYHIGVFRVRNLETLDFTVRVWPEGAAQALELAFRQQFYTE